jgi:hypothetical protein
MGWGDHVERGSLYISPFLMLLFIFKIVTPTKSFTLSRDSWIRIIHGFGMYLLCYYNSVRDDAAAASMRAWDYCFAKKGENRSFYLLPHVIQRQKP